MGIAGVALINAAIKVNANHIDVGCLGVYCGCDGTVITDNLITQALSGSTSATPGEPAIVIAGIPCRHRGRRSICRREPDRRGLHSSNCPAREKRLARRDRGAVYRLNTDDPRIAAAVKALAAANPHLTGHLAAMAPQTLVVVPNLPGLSVTISKPINPSRRRS
jgi:hypothetical protein